MVALTPGSAPKTVPRTMATQTIRNMEGLNTAAAPLASN